MAKTIEPLELGVWNSVLKQMINTPADFVQTILYRPYVDIHRRGNSKKLSE
jgi:hypothetical protein